jgi:hypothetical protein
MLVSWPFFTEFFHRRWGETEDAELLATDVDAEIAEESYPAG